MPEGNKKRTYQDHATAIGRSVRAIKGWVAIGRRAGKFCPLDDYALLPAWWVDVMRNAPPPCVLAAASKAGQKPAGGDGSAEQLSTPKKETAPPGTKSIDVGSLAPLTLAENVDQLRRQLVANQMLLQEAMAAAEPDDATVTMRQRNYGNTLKLLRDCERTLEELRVGRGELVEIAILREDLQRVHGAMATSLETSLVDRLKVPRDTARDFINAWFEHLRQSRFLPSGAPPAAATPS